MDITILHVLLGSLAVMLLMLWAVRPAQSNFVNGLKNIIVISLCAFIVAFIVAAFIVLITGR